MIKLCSYCKGEGRSLYSLGDIKVVKCPICSFVYVDENFTPEEMLKLYSGDFYDNYLFNVENIEELTAVELEKFIKKLSSEFNGGSLLDFGCAKGNFLNKLKNENLKLYGVDISPVETEEGRFKFALNLICGDIFKLNFEKDSFDFITSWDTIEHLQNPYEVLGEFRRILGPGGYLVVRIPSEDSLITKIFVFFYKVSFGIFKKPLMRIYNYHHLNSFSPEVLSRWLKSLDFEVIDIVQAQRYVTIYCLDKFNFFSRQAIKFLVWISKRMKKEAAFVIYAKKKAEKFKKDL